MIAQKIALATFWQILGKVSTMLMSLVSVKIVTTALAKDLVGPYFTVYEYLQFFGILADFGLYAVAVREVSTAERKEETLSTFFTLRLLITIFSLSLAVFVAFVLPSWQGTVLPRGVLVAAFVPFFTLLSGMERVVFQVHYKMQYAALAEALSRIVTVSLMMMLLFTGLRRDTSPVFYYLFLGSGGVGAVVLFLVSLLASRRFIKRSFSLHLSASLGYFRLAAPFGLAFLFTALYRQLDLTLISILRPQDFTVQTALYGAAFRVVESGILLPTFFLNSVLPTLTGRLEEGRDVASFAGKALLVILCLASTVALFSYFWARPIISLLTNNSYLETAVNPGSDTALRILSLPLFLNMLVMYCFYALLSRHAYRYLLFCLSLAAVLSLVLNISLIPSLGFLGAAYTSLLVHVLLACLLLPVGLKALPSALPIPEFAKWVQFTVILGVFLFLSSPYLQGTVSTLIGLFGGGGVVLVLLLALGLVPMTLVRSKG